MLSDAIAFLREVDTSTLEKAAEYHDVFIHLCKQTLQDYKDYTKNQDPAKSLISTCGLIKSSSSSVQEQETLLKKLEKDRLRVANLLEKIVKGINSSLHS